MRFLGLLKADEESEAGVPPTPELMAEMGKLMEEVTKAGVLLATDGLHPSSAGARVRLSGGKLNVTDGPFTESKELIASYALFEVKSIQEAIDWTSRFLKVLGKGECDIYQVFEASDFPAELFPPEEAAREEELRKKMQRNAASP
ncbi:MAG: YciI family protein [Vicinamibacteria bacterium]